MKRNAFLFLITSLLMSIGAYAEETTVVAPTPTEITTTTPAITPETTTEANPAEVATDNLEFVSGEVGELDEAGKTITVKLYGEAESTTTNKTLKVSVDASTDITDGEQDRDFKSLSAGTEIDVEYDPTTNKATYIFVY